MSFFDQEARDMNVFFTILASGFSLWHCMGIDSGVFLAGFLCFVVFASSVLALFTWLDFKLQLKSCGSWGG